jgi:hypothetical protein
MTTSRRAGPRLERVTLAVREHAPDLLGAAVALARDLQAQLAALFVEDLTLLRVAALPLTREVGRVSGVARALDLPDVERMLRRQAQQLREQLAATAQAASLAWSFEVRRGDLLEQALSLLAPEQAVVLGHRTAGLRAALDELTQVTALLDAADPELRALHVALQLAQGRPLAVLLTGPPEALPALRVRVEEELASSRAKARIELAPEHSLARLARTSAALRSRVLVLGGTTIYADPQALRALVQATSAPIILVG